MGSDDSESEADDGRKLSRARKSTRESSSQATPDSEGPDWASYDTKRALRILSKESDPEARKRILRKLHCKFWHATVEQLKPLLSAGGGPPSLIDEYREVVGTCKICRSWTRPEHRATTSTRLCSAFNELIEVDLFVIGKTMFCYI